MFWLIRVLFGNPITKSIIKALFVGGFFQFIAFNWGLGLIGIDYMGDNPMPLIVVMVIGYWIMYKSYKYFIKNS